VVFLPSFLIKSSQDGAGFSPEDGLKDARRPFPLVSVRVSAGDIPLIAYFFFDRVSARHF